MATRHQQKAGPSFPQRRGKRSATLQPLPKSPLVSGEKDGKKDEARRSSTTDEEESNVYIDVTCVDSDEDDLAKILNPKVIDENKNELDKKKEEDEKSSKSDQSEN